jgi:hypothetical protein
MVENITSFTMTTPMAYHPWYRVDRNRLSFVMPHPGIRRFAFDCLSLTASEIILSEWETWRLAGVYESHKLAKAAAKVQYTRGNIGEVITRKYGARYVRELISCPQVVQAEIQLLLGESCPIKVDYWKSSLELTWPEVNKVNGEAWKNRSGSRPVVLLDPLTSMPEKYEEILNYRDSQVFMLVSAKESAMPERAYDDQLRDDD